MSDLPLPAVSSAASDLPERRSQWHIFCRVVDNFGDIGVCWRLSQQLQREHAIQVTLWVDDLLSFKAIQPDIDSSEALQICAGVIVRHWQEPFGRIPAAEVGEVVIEAFGCELPDVYVDAMRRCRPLWINLEYLSAETWVRDCHKAPSPRFGLQKYFFFPGFEPGTGGLLWDAGLQALMEAESVTPSLPALLEALAVKVAVAPGSIPVSLFAYENGAITGLLEALAGAVCAVHLLVPEGRCSAQVCEWLGRELSPGQTAASGSLTITALPFMSQEQYDRLLAACHLNFVRGEESFVRSQMLGRPLIWQIYPQQDAAHLEKLQAFLDLYCQSLPESLARLLQVAHAQWNQAPEASVPDWTALVQSLPEWQSGAKKWQKNLLEVGDLALNLVTFCKNPV